MEFRWNHRRRLSRDVYRLYPSSPRRLRRFGPSLTFILVDTLCIRCPASSVDVSPRYSAAEIYRALEG